MMFFFSSRRRHTRSKRDWSSDVCSSDLLSVPGMRGLVPRFRRLRYRGFDAQRAPIDRTVEGFHARLVQHEVDHLDGILFPQRVRDLRNFGFEDALTDQLTPMPD